MTSRVQRDSNGDYHISSNLVHLLIVAVIGMMFTIVASILVWWHDEGSWRVRMEAQDELLSQRETALEKRTATNEAQIAQGILPGAEKRISRLEAEIDGRSKAR